MAGKPAATKAETREVREVREVREGAKRERPGKDYEPFFPATVVESQKYSPHFLVSCRSRCLRGKDAAPLLELLPRQAEASRSKGGKAEAKRREKASTRAPVPFEPQESRPKAESDALRAPEPERLVPSVEAEEAPCEAAEPEGKAGEPHDDAKNVADAEAVDRGNEAQLAEDEGDKAELAIPAPSLNAGALEFLPEPAEEMLVMEVVPRPDLPLDETFETQGFDGGLMGFDYGPSMEASTFDAGGGGYLEPMDGDPMAYQSYGGSYDGGYNASYEMGQMGYSAETHSYGSYDGYESNYPAQEYDSYGYMQEHGWSEPGWNDSAPFAGDEMPLQEVSQPSQRTWVFSQEDKESSAAPLAELPDPGLGRASLARRNEKGQGQQGQRHGGSSGKGSEVSRKSRTPSKGWGTQELWAYVDPRGKIQSGFSSSKMRGWFEAGFFKEHLEVALLKADGQVPPRRAFQPLHQVFPSVDRCFL